MSNLGKNMDCLFVILSPKEPGFLGGEFWRNDVFLNFLSNEVHSILYESWDNQLTFDILVNVFLKSDNLAQHAFFNLAPLAVAF